MEPVRDPEGIETDRLERLDCVQGRRVLEIGCGNGRLTWRYAELAAGVAGVDPDPDRLAGLAATWPADLKTPVLFAEAQAEYLPFADRAFDCAIFAWSL